MTDTGGNRKFRTDRVATGAAVHSAAWEATIEDARATAEDLEANGWAVVTLVAGDTAPESPTAGDTDRFGLSYVVPDNEAGPFRKAFDAGEFPRYEVYRAERAGRVFLLTVLLDPGSEAAILLAGTYERRTADECIRAAVEADEMYTHVQLLDGTHLGTFRHENYEKFFPDEDLAASESATEGNESTAKGTASAGDPTADAGQASTAGPDQNATAESDWNASVEPNEQTIAEPDDP